MRTIFVFGSNRQGRHGRGAALTALKHFGAKYGQAEGLQGDSYAIITKELRKTYPRVEHDEIEQGVYKFLQFATLHPQLHFILTPIGCGLAGFQPWEIAPMFRHAPCNVTLPTKFLLELARK